MYLLLALAEEAFLHGRAAVTDRSPIFFVADVKPVIEIRKPWQGEQEKVVRVGLSIVHDEAGTVSCYDTQSATPIKRRWRTSSAALSSASVLMRPSPELANACSSNGAIIEPSDVLVADRAVVAAVAAGLEQALEQGLVRQGSEDVLKGAKLGVSSSADQVTNGRVA